MKRLYTLLLAASLTAASAMAAAPVKMMTPVESTPQMAFKQKAFINKVNPHSQPAARAKAPMKAPSTITDYSSDYTWSNGWLLTGNACNSLSMNVDNAETGEVTITLPIDNIELKGTLDLTAGTLTIPNMQNLGVDSYGDTNYFYLKGADSEGNITDGATDAEASVGTVSGATITFPAMDIWAIGDPDNEDVGWWVLSYRNVLTVKEPEDPNKDPNEGWTSLGNAKFQDGWVLPGFGFDQTSPEYISEVELQQNDENPNVYRLVNPYKGNHPLARYNTSTATNGYIQFDVTDPDHVTFATVDAGFAYSQAGISELYCRNQLSYYVCGGYDPEFVVEQLGDDIPYTTFKDGVLTLKSIYDEETNTVLKNDAVFGTQSNINGAISWQNSEQEKIDMTTVITFPSTEGGEDPEPGEETWTALEGKGTWSDGFFTDASYLYFTEADNRWEVTIEQSDKTPGRYRILPYATGTYGAEVMAEDDNEHYFVINATNPEKVYVEGTWTPFGYFTFYHSVPENDEVYGEDQYYGRFADGIFSFPAKSFTEVCMNEYYETEEYYANNDGFMAVALPGYKLADTSFIVNAELCAENGKTVISYKAGSDLVAVKTFTVDGYLESSDAEMMVDEKGTSLDLTAAELTVDASAGLNSTAFVGYNAEGEITKSRIVYHYNNDMGTEETWSPLEGKLAKFNEGIFAPLLGDEPEEYTCAIEQSDKTPGRYRLVEPYAEYEPVEHDSHTHYLYIDATDADYVKIEPSALGVGIPALGDALIFDAIYLFEDYMGYSKSMIQAAGLNGTFANNTFSFPDECIYMSLNNFNNGALLYTGKDFTIEIIDDPESSIKEINAADETETVYHNLRGQRIAKPTVPGIYIHNNAKVFVR